MAKTEKQKLGRKGEDAAAAYLKNKGHVILKRNYRVGRTELDIVSLDGETLVVSEVKSYFTPPPEGAEFRVDQRKQRNIIRGTNGFLQQHPQYEQAAVRFDVLVVDFSRYPARVIHHEEAFWADSGWEE